MPNRLLDTDSLTVNKLLTIIDSISDGVFTVDLNFNLNFLNETAAHIANIDLNRAIGMKPMIDNLYTR